MKRSFRISPKFQPRSTRQSAASAPCELALSNQSPNVNATPFTIILDKTTKYRRIHHLINQQQCSKLVSSIVGTGRYIHINVMGEKDEDIAKPATLLTKENHKEEVQQSTERMQNQLSKQEKVNLEYVNSELKSRESMIKAKSIVINNFFNANGSEVLNPSDRSESKNHLERSRSIIRKRRVNGGRDIRQTNSALEIKSVPLSRSEINQNFSNLLCIQNTNANKILLTPKKQKEQYRYSLSQENRREAQMFIAKRKSSDEATRSKSPAIHSRKTDKYDISYSQYKQKQSGIHKDSKINKQNLVEEYQDFAIRNVLLSQKNKQYALRRFQEINRQRRRLNL